MADGAEEAKRRRNRRSPTVRRRELAALLRNLRKASGKSLGDAAEAIMISPTTLSRLETAQRSPSLRDVKDLCELYDVTEAERERLMTLARESRRRGWWQEYNLTYATYVGLEEEAVSLSEYQGSLIPGLLQVEGYARAIVEAGISPLGLDPEDVERRIAARMERQKLLRRPDAPHFTAIFDEGVLYRRVGGPAVMRAQLQRLVETADLPNVEIRVLPNGAGAHPAMDSTFCIIELAPDLVADVVYVEGLAGNIYMENPEDLERYRRVFEILRRSTLSEDESTALFKTSLKRYQSPQG